MSNHDQTPRNSNSSAPEQVPHSGVHGYERPVDEFDNTTLAEAHEQGLLTTPDTAARLAGEAQVDTQTTTVPPRQVGERRNTKESLPWYKKTVTKITGTVLGLVGVGVGVAVATQGSDNTAPVTPEQTNSAPADGETPANNETSPEEITVQPLSSETYTTPDQVVSGLFDERWSEWINAGANPETAETIKSDPVKSSLDHARLIAAEYRDPYVNALFTSDALKNPFVLETIQDNVAAQASTIDVYYSTRNDSEPYRRWIEVTSKNLISNDADSFIIEVRYVERDNAINNGAGEGFVESVDGFQGGYTVQGVKTNDGWKVNNLTKLD